MDGKHEATLKDVAKLSGVSSMTASRALRGEGNVSETTRKRVLEAAEQLGYRPNAIARSLVNGKTFQLGIVIPDITNPFFSGIIRGASRAAHKEGYMLLTVDSEEDALREAMMIERLLSYQLDGMIIVSSRLSQNVLIDLVKKFPAAVVINRTIDKEYGGSVLNEDEAGAYRATSFLLKQGSRKIAFLNGPDRSLSAQNRKQGYVKAHLDFNVTIDDRLILTTSPTERGGYEATKRLLENQSIQAIFSYNDLVAIGALRALQEFKISVPQDIKLIGYDDIPMASMTSPALSTVRVQTELIGEASIELIFQQMKGMAPDIITIPTELIIRDTT